MGRGDSLALVGNLPSDGVKIKTLGCPPPVVNFSPNRGCVSKGIRCKNCANSNADEKKVKEFYTG